MGSSRASSVGMPQLYITFGTCGVGRKSRPCHQEYQRSLHDDMYTPADDKFRLKWPRRETAARLEETSI